MTKPILLSIGWIVTVVKWCLGLKIQKSDVNNRKSACRSEEYGSDPVVFSRLLFFFFQAARRELYPNPS